MFDYSKIKESVAAGVLAILLSATAIAATVGPAQAVETGSSGYAQAPIASARA